MSRLDSREYDWFVLCVAPQRELAVEKILGGEGFATFVPTRREFRFANHIARMKKRKTEKTYPLFPRYILLGCQIGRRDLSAFSALPAHSIIGGSAS